MTMLAHTRSSVAVNSTLSAFSVLATSFSRADLKVGPYIPLCRGGPSGPPL
jgi:hypothetical protein